MHGSGCLPLLLLQYNHSYKKISSFISLLTEFPFHVLWPQKSVFRCPASAHPWCMRHKPPTGSGLPFQEVPLLSLDHRPSGNEFPRLSHKGHLLSEENRVRSYTLIPVSSSNSFSQIKLPSSRFSAIVVFPSISRYLYGVFISNMKIPSGSR